MEKTKVVAIIQAHMSSSRLPGKVMKDLCGMPTLYRMIERVQQSKYTDKVIVATSTMDCDDVIIEACEKWGVSTFRGSDNDVLERFWGAAQAYPAGAYVRLTSDCPLFDPEVLDETIQYFWNHDFRYVRSNDYQNRFINAGQRAHGFDCEVFTAELLKEAAESATELYEHIHVTPYMYTKQDSVGCLPNTRDTSMYRLTLDTPEDYEVIKRIYEALYQPGNRFYTDAIADYLEAHPEVVAINSMTVQKTFKDVT